tara:strand:- start:17090 stop:17308 length:219 start_codon:yes stop_codon:yes gene_type:complete
MITYNIYNEENMLVATQENLSTSLLDLLEGNKYRVEVAQPKDYAPLEQVPSDVEPTDNTFVTWCTENEVKRL